MAKTPQKEYQNARKAIQDEIDDGSVTESDADAIWEFLDAKDPDKLTVVDHTDDKPKEPATLTQYAYTLKLVCRRFGTPLSEATADELNEFFSALMDGSHPNAKEGGYAKGTVRQQQGIVRKFYRYHDALDVDPEDIAMLKPQETSVDERDVFDDEDVEALRNACENPRDRCLLELLLYTGQRIGVLLTLRVKDVKPDEGVFWLNGDVDGLKGADERGLKRPLLGAKAAVRDWLKYHPTNDPDDYLLTCLPGKGRSKGVPGDRMHYSSIKDRIDRIGESADIDKPVKAHNFRHYFATVAKRDYDLDSDTIKFLLGHSKDSTVMESTYAHLTNDDYIKEAREARGEIEPEDKSPMTPAECQVCDEPLPNDARACPRCGTVYTPDAKHTQDQIKETVQEKKDDAETLDEHKRLDKLERLVNDNPELLDALEDMAEE